MRGEWDERGAGGGKRRVGRGEGIGYRSLHGRDPNSDELYIYKDSIKLVFPSRDIGRF